MRRLAAARAILVAAMLAGVLAPWPAAAEDAATRAAADPIWRALLHQSRHPLDRASQRSLHEADFFFDEAGHERPDRELLATIHAMTQPDAALALAARCRFPARHLFLASRDLVPGERGVCPDFDSWRATIGEVRMTLVFPEAFLGNPSSMFGHTLLRFDPIDLESNETREALLGWTLDYTADPGEDGGLLYLIRGLLGGYRGQFDIAPYYQKIKVYSDWQDRDIWEYPLALEPDEIERILLHVWEMEGVTLPYVFFTKNCSEYLLDMLEVGPTGIERGGGLPPAVTPVDTLRAIVDRDSTALGEPSLRASPATRLQEALGEIDARDASLVFDLADGSRDPSALADRGDEEKAKLLTLAYDFLRHSVLAGRLPSEESRTRSNELLRARSRIRVPVSPPRDLTHLERTPPHEGHGTSRVESNAGVQDREAFIELRAQPAFHTQIDAPGGFAEGGEIKLLDTAVRVHPESGRVRLQELVVLDVTTASPWRRPFRPLAWHTEMGARTRLFSRERRPGLQAESTFRLQGGMGAAIAPISRLHLYAFGELALEAASGIEGNAVAGPLVRTGFSWSTRRGGYTLHAEGVAGLLMGESTHEWLGAKLEQRVRITRTWSAASGGHFERAYGVGHFEGRFGFIRYF